MSRLSEKFATLRSRGERALIPYLTAGYPSPAHTVQLLQSLEEGGADVIELGVPFSDPLADGPTIQAASSVALDHGVTLPQILEMVREFRKTGSETPIVLFGAYNPYFHYGLERFANDAKEAGADAVLIADLPVEEADEAAPILKAAGLDLICLIAPTSNLERKRIICEHGSGFLYYISVKGVTGARQNLSFELEETISEIKSCTDLPVAVGFGISTAAQAKQVGEWADGVVVGSALIDLITRNSQGADNVLYSAVAGYMRELKEALPTGEVKAGLSS